jgi:hypothetical protein
MEHTSRMIIEYFRNDWFHFVWNNEYDVWIYALCIYASIWIEN